MDAINNTLHILFPDPSQRIPITSLTWPILVVPFIPAIYMSYLMTKPNSHNVLLFLFPITVGVSVHAAFGYHFSDSELQASNYAFCYIPIQLIARAIEYVSVGRQYTRLANFGSTVDAKKVVNGNGYATEEPWYSWFTVGFEVLTPRAIGWDTGLSIHLPLDPRPQDKFLFLRATALDTALSFVKVDMLTTFLDSVPGLQDGGSIWLPTLSLIPRYVLSTMITIAVGTLIKTVVELVHGLLTLIGVGLLKHAPYLWPPLFDNPWASESLHDLWSKRWHQMLRRNFVYVGGYPGHIIAGRFGLVMGSFAVSAYFHEFGFYTMGKGWDNKVVYFFIVEGFCVVLEEFWRQITGRRVGGLPGRLWAYLNVFTLGQFFVNSAIQRGATKGISTPIALSPTKLLLLPIISKAIA